MVNSQINATFKDALSYVCKTKCGYTEELEKQIANQCIMTEFDTVGFITKGHTKKATTWKKTKFADQYYKDLYGQVSYWCLQLTPYKHS
jgi:UDP-galactopyranose mutase